MTGFAQIRAHPFVLVTMIHSWIHLFLASLIVAIITSIWVKHKCSLQYKPILAEETYSGKTDEKATSTSLQKYTDWCYKVAIHHVQILPAFLHLALIIRWTLVSQFTLMFCAMVIPTRKSFRCVTRQRLLVESLRIDCVAILHIC